MKSAVLIVKFYPIIVNIWLCLILSGVISDSLYPIFGHGLAVDFLLLVLSYLFRFCSWHRILIYSMMANVTLEFLQNNGVFFSDSFCVSLTLTITSLVLSTILYYRNGCYTKKNTHKRFKNGNKTH